MLIFAKLAQALEKAGQPITGENLLKQRKAMASFDVVGGKLTFLPNGTVSRAAADQRDRRRRRQGGEGQHRRRALMRRLPQ